MTDMEETEIERDNSLRRENRRCLESKIWEMVGKYLGKLILGEDVCLRTEKEHADVALRVPIRRRGEVSDHTHLFGH